MPRMNCDYSTLFVITAESFGGGFSLVKKDVGGNIEVGGCLILGSKAFFCTQRT